MLNDQSFDAPVIYIVSESPRLEMLQARLRQSGTRPVPVRGNYLPPDSAPALIDLSTREIPIEPGDTRLIVTLGRQREKQRRREIDLRSQTLAEFGVERASSSTQADARLLWLGHDAPFLNVLRKSLKDSDISFVAAISCLTAEDYLESGRFRVVALCPSQPNDEACKLLATVKQLPLAQPPKVLLLLRREVSVQLDNDLIGKADQIIDVGADLESVAERLRAACADRTETTSAGPAILSTLAHDATSGLASRAYLDTHLQAQMDQADQSATPLSVISIDLKSEDDVRAVAHKINALKLLIPEAIEVRFI